jgi:hypothetical protein
MSGHRKEPHEMNPKSSIKYGVHMQAISKLRMRTLYSSISWDAVNSSVWLSALNLISPGANPCKKHEMSPKPHG